MQSRMQSISGWGNSHRAQSHVATPASIDELAAGLAASDLDSIACRGCGRSYGDQSTIDGGLTIDATNLQDIEDFDPISGTLVCLGGCTLAQIVDRFLPQGFVPAVCPGTGFVTVGGAVANDVHGKNHYANGSFCDHLLWVDLLRPDGSIVRASDTENPELFLATIGGIGLTGIIVRAAIRLQGVTSAMLDVVDEPIRELGEFMTRLREVRTEATHSVGWIDATTGGNRMGRGILSTAEVSPDSGFESRPTQLRPGVPLPMPQGLLNRHAVRLFNTAYRLRVRRKRAIRVPFRKFVFPLDAIHHWNRLYGRRGVYQFQCVISFDVADDVIPELMTIATASSHSSPLAVLKTLSRKGRGMLSFPQPGFTLALDFPRNESTHRTVMQLYSIAAAAGGRAYLAKDACLSASLFRRMYPAADSFADVITGAPGSKSMVSDMAMRLGIGRDPESERSL